MSVIKMEKKECNYCGVKEGEFLNDELLEDPEVPEDHICTDCYHERHEFTCEFCENWCFKEDGTENYKFVLTPDIAEETGLVPGVYSVKEFPFHYGNILSGFDGFYKDTIKLVRNMNVNAVKLACHGIHCQDVGTGRICYECFQFLTQPLNKVLKSQMTYINMSMRQRVHRSISIKKALS